VGSQPAGRGVEAVWGRPFGELGGDIGFGGDGRKGLGGEAEGRGEEMGQGDLWWQ
jgi:hypothetical protein